MKYRASSVASFLLSVSASAYAFVPCRLQPWPSPAVLSSAAVVQEGFADAKVESLTNDLISKLRFRAVRRELEQRALDTSGTFSAMKDRLREAVLGTKMTGTPIENLERARAINGDALAEVSRNYLYFCVGSHVVGDSPAEDPLVA
jgi:hypothetical protein